MMMRARKAMVYDGRQVAAGEVFDLIEAHVESAAVRRVLLAAGLAEDVSANDDTPQPKRRVYKRRDMRAEQ